MSWTPPPTDATLNAINVDDLGRMLMALTQEVWVMRDRMAVTELLLADKVGIGADEIEAYVADPATKAQIEALRDRFAAKVLGAPVAGRERSVDAILERAGMARPQPEGAA
ncbi:hypothetical protein GTZ99_16545 [Novosphingobium sp. FSY-8]|uniref:Uncharacterized protein n=1 Tax=Novosphingobium ovatum TaxID=1908523 RepID=A0ABW9XI26_9SPHN|nr:DUF5333 domain-containing protein [Novosphingobium ovatum]NBC38161.1 hypothetical protein [Novosphingobium ovatum]